MSEKIDRVRKEREVVDAIADLWIKKVWEAGETVEEMVEDLAADLGMDLDEGEVIDDAWDEYEELMVTVMRRAKIVMVNKLLSPGEFEKARRAEGVELSDSEAAAEDATWD